MVAQFPQYSRMSPSDLRVFVCAKRAAAADGAGGGSAAADSPVACHQFGFWFLICYAAKQLAIRLQQECIQVVCSNREARKHPAESNGTPAMDLEFEDIRKRRYTDKQGKEQNTRPYIRNMYEEHTSVVPTGWSGGIVQLVPFF